MRPRQKDTMFRDLFKAPARFIPLLEECRGQKVKFSAEEITPFDLETDYAVRPRRNDISFLADGKIIILIEHQSTINPNMALRLFLYYNELLQLWIKQNNIDLYKKEKIKNLPQPEFYVVYDGKETLKENYSTFRTHHEGINIDIKVKIVDIRYKNLSDTTPKNPLAGYAYFWHEQNENIKKGLTKQDAFETARQTCIQKGYLEGYIEKEGFIMFYKDFLNYDNQVKAEIREEVREETIIYAIKANTPQKILESIAEQSGISHHRLQELIRQAQEEKLTA